MSILKRAALGSAILIAAYRSDAQPMTTADIKGRWVVADTTEGKITLNLESDSVLKFEIIAPGMPAISMDGKFWLEFKSGQNVAHFVVKDHGTSQYTCQILKLDGDNQLTLQNTGCTNPAWKEDSEETVIFRRVGT